MTYQTQRQPFGTWSRLAVAALGGAVLLTAADGAGLLMAQETKVATVKPANTKYPQIVKTSPAIGAMDVKASLKEISVTFDRDMGRGMSWTGGPPHFPTTDKSRKAKWVDKRTCVLPVKLEPKKLYRVGINGESYRNFQSADGVPVPPAAIYFVTGVRSAKVKAMAKIPEVVKIDPPNGATDVDANVKQIAVTFNIPMSSGMSWTGGGPNFPESPQGKRARWSADKKTCTLPVVLRPDHKYRIGLNSLSFRNFSSASGIPLEPVVYEIKTK